MARPARNFGEGIYHLAIQGSDTRFLFPGDADRAGFEGRLDRTLQRFELDVVDYVLMGNHYHLVLRIVDARVSTALQELHTGYSRDHNKRAGRRAHLFQAHFFSREITSDDDLLNVCRYLACNPVEAGLAPGPLDWPWSSARAHAGIEPPRIRLEEGPLRAAFDDAVDWRERYRALIANPVSDTGFVKRALRRLSDDSRRPATQESS